MSTYTDHVSGSEKKPVDASTYNDIRDEADFSVDKMAKKLVCNKGALAIIIKSLVDGCDKYTYAELCGKIGNITTKRHMTADMGRDDTDEDLLENAVQMLPTEMSSPDEKLLRFDVYLTYSDIRSENVYNIDVEIQRVRSPKYPLIKRAVYYVSRAISRQLGAITEKTDFGQLTKVYSIWLMIMGSKKHRAGIVTYKLGCMGDVDLLPKNFRGNEDLIEIDFVFAGNLENTDKSKRDLFSLVTGMYVEPKLLKELFTCEIPEEVGFSEEVERYMSITEAIAIRSKNEGIAEGMVEGKAETAMGLYLRNIDTQIITEITGFTEVEIKKLIEENTDTATGKLKEQYTFKCLSAKNEPKQSSEDR